MPGMAKAAPARAAMASQVKRRPLRSPIQAAASISTRAEAERMISGSVRASELPISMRSFHGGVRGRRSGGDAAGKLGIGRRRCALDPGEEKADIAAHRREEAL